MSRRQAELSDETKPVPIWGWIQDRLYDTVFHIGDSAQQFLWDTMRGPENARHDGYVDRQLQRTQRQTNQKPLNFEERQAFAELLQRGANESLVEFWKRRKALLDHPDKRDLAEQALAVKANQAKAQSGEGKAQAATQQKQLEEEFRRIQRASRGHRHSRGQSQ